LSSEDTGRPNTEML